MRRPRTSRTPSTHTSASWSFARRPSVCPRSTPATRRPTICPTASTSPRNHSPHPGLPSKLTPLRLPSSLQALSEPRFRLLWAGQATSAIGDGLMSIALAFAVLRIGGSATQLGLVLAVGLASRVAFYLAGGGWAARVAPPRRVVS